MVAKVYLFLRYYDAHYSKGMSRSFVALQEDRFDVTTRGRLLLTHHSCASVSSQQTVLVQLVLLSGEPGCSFGGYAQFWR